MFPPRLPHLRKKRRAHCRGAGYAHINPLKHPHHFHRQTTDQPRQHPSLGATEKGFSHFRPVRNPKTIKTCTLTFVPVPFLRLLHPQNSFTTNPFSGPTLTNPTNPGCRHCPSRRETRSSGSFPAICFAHPLDPIYIAHGPKTCHLNSKPLTGGPRDTIGLSGAALSRNHDYLPRQRVNVARLL